MSRTIRNTKGPGYDYQSRRHPYNACIGYGPYVKRLTHRLERRQAKAQLEVETPSGSR